MEVAFSSLYGVTRHSIQRLKQRFIGKESKGRNRWADVFQVMKRDSLRDWDTAIQKYLKESAQQGQILIDYKQHRYILNEDMLLVCIKVKKGLFTIKTVFPWGEEEELSIQSLIYATDRNSIEV